MKTMKLRGNLAKSFLQMAEQFSEPATAIWEYVVNSIEYRERLDGCIVNVTITKNEVIISDNGSGMDDEVLYSFFTLSGENLARNKKQKSVLKRGKFGTGKSAAFGIADELEVDTIKDGIRNSYKIDRKTIQSVSQNSDSIPLEELIRNEKTKQQNGTKIIIRNLNTKIDLNRLIRKIEAEIASLRGNDIKIAVNSQLCEIKDLDIESEFVFQSEGKVKDRYGDFELKIQVSRTPLEKYDRGINILCDKNKIGIEDCGISTQEFGNFITGEVDVPDLENPINNIAPFNQTRNLSLNPEHIGVKELILFMGPKLEIVRKKIADKKNEERNSIQNKKLSQITNDLSNKFNDSWNEMKRKLDVIREGSNAKNAFANIFEPGDEGEIDGYIDGEGNYVSKLDELRIGDLNENSSSVEDPQEIFKEDENSKDTGKKESGNKRKKRSSGFLVKHENLGESSHKSIWRKEELSIVINLDHPCTDACLKSCRGDVENQEFKRFLFETASREFEHAFAQEMISENDGQYPAEDVLTEMRYHYDQVIRTIGREFYIN